MTSSYPRSLSYFVKRLSNYSRNTFRLTCNKDTNVTPGSIISVELPSNSLIDMNTLCFHFKATTTATGGDAGLPKHVESLIDKISVEIGNKAIASCSSLNHVYNLLLQYQQGQDALVKRKIYQYGEGADTAVAVTDRPCCIHSLLGFCSSVKPECLNSIRA
jgi:hypothetical protein